MFLLDINVFYYFSDGKVSCEFNKQVQNYEMFLYLYSCCEERYEYKQRKGYLNKWAGACQAY